MPEENKVSNAKVKDAASTDSVEGGNATTGIPIAGSTSPNWDAFATLPFPQAVLRSDDIQFQPNGIIEVKRDSAQSLLANAVLQLRRNHPILKLPKALSTLPTPEPILKEVD